MHDSCQDTLRVFVSEYLGAYGDHPISILDVGSAVVESNQPSDRDVITSPHWRYIGLDIMPGHNVDVVVNDPYDWKEIPTASVDAVICNQVLEHAEYFWLTVKEIARVLKPRGLAVLIAPSAGLVHRYPTDCWRFFPDGLPAVARYANLTVLENHRQNLPLYPKGNRWRDATLIAQKPMQPEGEPSILPIMQPKGALEARDKRLLAGQSTWSLKWRAIKPHIRAVSRILRYPAAKLGDIDI